MLNRYFSIFLCCQCVTVFSNKIFADLDFKIKNKKKLKRKIDKSKEDCIEVTKNLIV